MQHQDSIEKLFKDTFQNFEANVNPNIWTNVQSGINAGAGSAAGSAAKFAVGKIIAGAVAVAGIAGSTWYFSHSEMKKDNSISENKNKTEIISSTSSEKQNMVSQNQTGNHSLVSNSEKKNHTSAITSNQTSTGNPGNNNSESTESTISNDNSASDNIGNSSQPTEHKYGNATKGDGGMMRENHPSYSKASSSDNSSSNSNDGDAENLPAANIFVTTSSGDAPLNVTFMNQGSGSSLVWDFGDGTSSKENSPTHLFEKAGNYEVTLTAKNSAGNITAKVAIEVKSISSIGNIPNVFTPNGDGKNEIFVLDDLKNIASIGVVIYSFDRGIVYQWNSLDGGWNGKLMNGADAGPGIYFYSIQAIGTDGVSHSQNGSITLTR